MESPKKVKRETEDDAVTIPAVFLDRSTSLPERPPLSPETALPTHPSIMFTSKLALPVWLLFLGSVAAVPAPGKVTTPDPANLEPWVTVNKEGIPKTVTPVWTTIKGTPTLLNAAPFEVTANAVTKRPSPTGTALAQPAATSKGDHKEKGSKKGGAFAKCNNMDGEFRPFCLPSHNDLYFPGSTHYVTWDPEFFSGNNSTIKVLGYYVTNTTSATHPNEEIEAFSSDGIPSGWGFYQWRVEKSPPLRAIRLRSPTVTLRKKPGRQPQKSKVPDQTAIYIAMPIVFGFAGIMIAASICWNRQARIDIGSIVASAKARRSRRRKGGNVYHMVGNGGRKTVGGSDSEGEDRWSETWGARDSEARGKKVFERVDRKRR
ncbi:hypothetical protein N0V88_004203 [Collariella sp. IMI 366227]|nr:hypothetical protein N0V88_004203 [Collariella sp. IMI 366227]